MIENGGTARADEQATGGQRARIITSHRTSPFARLPSHQSIVSPDELAAYLWTMRWPRRHSHGITKRLAQMPARRALARSSCTT